MWPNGFWEFGRCKNGPNLAESMEFLAFSEYRVMFRTFLFNSQEAKIIYKFFVMLMPEITLNLILDSGRWKECYRKECYNMVRKVYYMKVYYKNLCYRKECYRKVCYRKMCYTNCHYSQNANTGKSATGKCATQIATTEIMQTQERVLH